MSIPTYYLTSTKNVDGILNAVQAAQAPTRFTLAFLEGLGYKSSSDRLIINVLKALGFLNADGAPTERYYRFLDQGEAPKVLAEGLREAYSDLYQLNKTAEKMSKSDIKNKLRTITQGQYSDDVLGKMANTFLALAGKADFSQGDRVAEALGAAPDDAVDPQDADEEAGATAVASRSAGLGATVGLSGLSYNIQIHLPESRDQAVYDAVFRSLKAHLFA